MPAERIPLAELEHGVVYELRSRNLAVGAWSARRGGFVGIREKFDHRSLFTEYEREVSKVHGTAIAVRRIGPLPEGVVVHEHLDGAADANDALFDFLVPIEREVHERWRQEDEATTTARVAYRAAFPAWAQAIDLRHHARTNRVMARIGHKSRRPHGVIKHARDQMRHHLKQAAVEVQTAIQKEH